MIKRIQVDMRHQNNPQHETVYYRLLLLLALLLCLGLTFFVNRSSASANGQGEETHRIVLKGASDVEGGTAENATNAIAPDIQPLDIAINERYPKGFGIATDYALQIMQVPQAWSIHNGSPEVIIAVIDTGLHMTHPEFAGRVVPGYDFVNDDDDPSDDHGHGTHISGIIAASMDDGAGTTGVCPHCRIMPIKVLDEHNFGYWETIVEGITFAVDHGADIINLSLGSLTSTPVLEEAILYALQRDVLIVAAAGNRDTDTKFYPAALPYANIITVSATDKHDKKWAFSNYGDYIDVAAPGNFVYSTDINEDDPNDWGYSIMSGTSMAAPHVAGLAGLLLSQDMERTPVQLIQVITETADDLSAQGWDPVFGYGRINAYAALLHEQPDNYLYFPLLRR